MRRDKSPSLQVFCFIDECDRQKIDLGNFTPFKTAMSENKQLRVYAPKL
ncbi:MAG: hypothetical protein V7K39_00880 [Nostoc sp.]